MLECTDFRVTDYPGPAMPLATAGIAPYIRTMSKWISIADGLPEEGCRVHFYSPEWDELFVGCRYGGRWFDETNYLALGQASEIRGVTHWLPMPAKPFMEES